MAGAIIDPNKLLENIDPAIAEQAQLAADALGSAFSSEDEAPPPHSASSGDGASENTGSASRISTSLDLAAEQLEAEATGAMQKMRSESGILGKIDQGITAAGAGALKSIFETYDFIAGETPQDRKSDFRTYTERQAAMLDRASPVNAISGDVSQFVTGMVGLGKFTKLAQGSKVVQGGAKIIDGSKKLRAIAASGQAAAVGSVVFDPYEERIGNLVKSLPGMEDSIFAYTAADPDDSEAEGRFKSALESIGIDFALAGALALTLKGYKHFKAGNLDEADKFFKEAEEAAPADQSSWMGGARPAMEGEEQLVRSGEASGTMQGPGGVDPLKMASEPDSLTISGKATGRFRGPAPIAEPLPGTGQTIEMPGTEGAATATPGGPGAPFDAGLPKQGSATSTSGAATGRQLPTWSAGNGNKDEVFGLKLEPPEELDAQGFAASDGGDEFARAMRETGVRTKPVKQADSVASAKEIVGGGEQSVNIASDVKFTNRDVAKVMDTFADDMAAVARHGSREAAQAAGYSFTPTSVPWSKFNGTDDLRSFIDSVGSAKTEDLARIKGGDVLSDARLMDQVRQQAIIFGEDPAIVLGNLARAGKEAPAMVSTMMAGKAVTMKIMDDAYQLSRLIQTGAAGDRGEAVMRLKRLLAMGGEALAYTNSIRSNAARTTRAGRFGISMEHLQRLNDMDGDALLEAIYASKGNPNNLVEAAKPGFWARFNSGAQKTWTHLFTNNLLFWYPTHVVNFTANMTLLGMRSLEKQVGSLFIKGAQGRAIRKQAAYEYGYTLASIHDGFEMAVEAFRRGDSVLNPHDMDAVSNSGASGGRMKLRPVNTLADMIGYAQFATGLPTRALGAMDEFTKTLRYRSVIQARAAMEAEKLGLDGLNFKEFVQKKMADAYDETGAALDSEALMEARIATFNDPLENAAGLAVQEAVGKLPWLRVIVPFVRTPFKALGYGVRMTPGLQFAHSRFKADFAGAHGAEAQAQAYGQMALGGLASMVAVSLAGSGKMTGSGPNNPEMREYLTSKGWKPYSIIIDNDDGSRTYLPIGRLDPVGTVMGIAADLVDISSHPTRVEDGQNMFTMLAIAMAKNVTNKTFLLGLQNFVRAVADPEKSASKWAGNIAEATIPFSALVKGLNNDDLLREARTMTDHALDRMPGFSKTMAPRYDVLSEPQLVHKGLWASGEWDELDDELARLNTETGKGLSKVSPDLNDTDLRDVKLADGRSGYQAVNEAIAKAGIKKHLKALVLSSAYINAPDGLATDQIGSKLWMISTQATKFRNAIKRRVVSQHRELVAAYMKKKSDAIGAVALKKQEDAAARKAQEQNVLGKALSSLGIAVGQ